MITTKRLQEIKEDIKRGRKLELNPSDWETGYEGIYDVMDELITALEVCKNNLSLTLDSDIETQKKLESSDEKLVDEYAINARLYTALEAAQAELAKEKKECEQYAWEYASSEKDSIDLRAQLAEAQEENLRLQAENKGIIEECIAVDDR